MRVPSRVLSRTTEGGAMMVGGRRAVGVVGWLADHWLYVVALAVAVYVALAFAAPALAMLGWESPSAGLYFLFRLACHQLPYRSWFIGGEAASYDWIAVRDHLGLADGQQWSTYHQPVRDPVMGYQVALCQRDVAVFTAFILAALALAVVRRRRAIRPLPFAWLVLASAPAAVDGLTQLPGWRESTPGLRTLTGALFGAAVALFTLPMIDEGLREADTPRPVACDPPLRVQKPEGATTMVAPSSSLQPAVQAGMDHAMGETTDGPTGSRTPPPG